MRNSTFDRWLLGASALVALLVLAGVVTVQNTRKLNENAGWVAYTLEVVDVLSQVSRHMQEAEAIQRTFIITGGKTIPAGFATSIDAAKLKAERLKDLTKDNGDQQTRNAELMERIGELQ